MKQTIILTSNDPVLQELDFKPYRSGAKRHFKRFMPDPDQPQEIDILSRPGAKRSQRRPVIIWSVRLIDRMMLGR